MKGEYEGAYGDWAIKVYFEHVDEVLPWEEGGWRWSAIRFRNPQSEDDDRFVSLGGQAVSAKGARLCAFAAAKRYDKKVAEARP